MPDIFPAADKSVSDILNGMRELGLVDGVDYYMHFTYDARPFVRSTDEAHDKWIAANPGVEATESEDSAEQDPAGGNSEPVTAAAETEDSAPAEETQAPAKTTPKRR